MKNKIIGLIFLMVFLPMLSSYSQGQNYCGTISPDQNKLMYLNLLFHQWLSEGGTIPTEAPIAIPIAFHIIMDDQGNGNVSNDRIQQQLEVLNSIQVRTLGYDFILYSIDRTYNSSWFYHSNGSQAEIDMKNARAINPLFVLNFYICELNDPYLLGYAKFPDDYDEDSKMHGVVVKHTTLPNGSQPGYSDGKTGAHEVGHFLGLFHTYEGGCIGDGDHVDDTPSHSGPSGDCLQVLNTCPDNGEELLDPIHNYMNYLTDACMTEFTYGQKEYAWFKMTTYRPSMINGITINYKNVSVYQKFYNSEVNIDSIGVWDVGLNQFLKTPAPISSFWIIDSYKTLKGAQKIIDNQKYRHWEINNQEVNNVVNHKTFQIYTSTNNLTSRFNPDQDNVTIKNGLELSSANGGNIQFKDPWLVDESDQRFYEHPYGYRNLDMGAPFKTESSPFNPNFNSNYKGVFLNQEIAPNKAFYSVKAISPQDISLTHTGKTHRFYFQNWSRDFINGEPSAEFQDSMALQTGVVFKKENAVVKANMKGTQLSNEVNAYANNSQRKLVRGFSQLGGGFFNTYTSMNKVWLEFNDNSNGGTVWQIMNNGKPLSDNESKNPSIDYWEANASETFAFVVYQEKNTGDGYRIKIKVFNQDTINILYDGEVVNETTESFETDANPVIAVGKGFDNIYINTIMVCWYKKDNGDNRPAGLYMKYGYFYFDYGANEYIFNWLSTLPIKITGTNTNSIKSSLSAPKQIAGNYDFVPFHLVYGESNQINYNKIRLRGNGGIIPILPSLSISNRNGYTANYCPSVIAMGDTSSRICWLGERIEEPGHIEKTVVFTSSDNLGRFWTFGSRVNSTSINLMNDRYTIAWAKTDDDYLEYTDSRTLRDIGRINIKGKDVQLSNGTGLTTMRALAFNTSTLPYYMQTAQIYTYQDPIKTDEKREGIVSEEDAQVYFSVGDATVDNEQISFVEIPDTVTITSQQSANQYLVSESFSLTDNSEFFYSVKYGLTDSLAALSMLSSNKSLTFKVELLDVVTSEVLGVFDEVTYDQGNLVPYEKVDYQVLTNGIGTRTVKLRLVINSNFSPDYSIAERYDTESNLAKKHYKQISFQGSLAVKEYALEQNYPNPFNPTTTINYQIKEDGLVTLKIYDILGSEIKTLVNEEKTQGRYSYNFNASDLASGVYIYQLRVNDYVSSKKLLLLK